MTHAKHIILRDLSQPFVEGQYGERHRDGRYKYRTLERMEIFLPRRVLGTGKFPLTIPSGDESGPWVKIQAIVTSKGLQDTMELRSGYAWDGPSGALDTPSFMLASLVHDALYQCHREGLLPLSRRGTSDAIMRIIAQAQGMSRIRAWYTWVAVRAFGAGAAKA